MTTHQPAALPERFTKKPVTIEAVQFRNDGSSYALIQWINEGQHAAGRRFASWQNHEIIVPTLEGEHIASPGDWIIKGVKGEFYPCKPVIFEMTYDRAALQSQPAATTKVGAPSGMLRTTCPYCENGFAFEQPAAAAVSDAEWDGAEEWMPLAWALCADECGEEACTELVWEGGPIPEPWGDRWLKYEDEAKRLIELVRKHVPALRPQAVPMTDEPVAYFSYGEDSGYLEHATAEDASKHAKEEITAYREDAKHDNEWPSEVDSVCWGVVLQKATAVDNSDEVGQESFDYELAPRHGITAQGAQGEQT